MVPSHQDHSLDSFSGNKGLVPATRERVHVLWEAGGGVWGRTQRPFQFRFQEVMGTLDCSQLKCCLLCGISE